MRNILCYTVFGVHLPAQNVFITLTSQPTHGKQYLAKGNKSFPLDFRLVELSVLLLYVQIAACLPWVSGLVYTLHTTVCVVTRLLARCTAPGGSQNRDCGAKFVLSIDNLQTFSSGSCNQMIAEVRTGVLFYLASLELTHFNLEQFSLGPSASAARWTPSTCRSSSSSASPSVTIYGTTMDHVHNPVYVQGVKVG